MTTGGQKLHWLAVKYLSIMNNEISKYVRQWSCASSYNLQTCFFLQTCFAACIRIPARVKRASFNRCLQIFFRHKIHYIPVRSNREKTSAQSSVAMATVSAALIYLVIDKRRSFEKWIRLQNAGLFACWTSYDRSKRGFMSTPAWNVPVRM